MSKAIIRIKTVRTKTTDEIIGYRLEAAIPNENGRQMRARRDATGEVISFYATAKTQPSFTGQYLIEQSSDMTVVQPKAVKRFMENLHFHGYDKFVAFGRWPASMQPMFVNQDDDGAVRWV